MSYELHQGKAVPGVWGDAAKGLFTQACAGQSNSENNLFLTPHTRGDQCCFSISAVWLQDLRWVLRTDSEHPEFTEGGAHMEPCPLLGCLSLAGPTQHCLQEFSQMEMTTSG